MKKLILVAALGFMVFCSAGPPAPVLIEPADGNYLYANTTFMWSKVPEAKRYRIEFAADDAFLTGYWESQVTDTTYVLDYQLLNPEVNTYYWRVSAGNDDVWGDPSVTWMFLIAGGGKP